MESKLTLHETMKFSVRLICTHLIKVLVNHFLVLAICFCLMEQSYPYLYRALPTMGECVLF